MRKVLSILIVLVVSLSMTSFIFSDTLSDIENHWAKEYIKQLINIGAVKGYSDGTFRPNDTITRAEFTAIMLRAMGKDVGQPNNGKWYENYIKEARKEGYIKEGEFIDPNLNISRMEISKMITRALEKEEAAKKMASEPTGFKDDESIADPYKGYVKILKSYGIIDGTLEGYFLPNKTATRAEAAKMIITFLNSRNKDIQDEEPQGSYDDIYMYDWDTKKEVKIETSHPELIPHVKKGIEILSTGGYTDALYTSEDNFVQFYFYKDKAEAEKPRWEQETIMSYHIYLKKNPRSSVYLPFGLHLYNTDSVIGQEKIKLLVNDVFPEAYEIVVKELENKVNDVNYHNKVWKEISGREIRIFTFKGHNQIDVYIAPEK